MKYKELRMLLIMSIMFIFAISASIYFMISDTVNKGIIAFIFSFIILVLLLTKYKMQVKESFAIIYVYYGIAIVPMIISFKDIVDVTLVSKHKLKIQYPKTITVYIVDAKSFYDELQSALSIYKEKNKQIKKPM